MIRHTIIRNTLYSEEKYDVNSISMQIGVRVKHLLPKMDVFELTRNGNFYEQSNLVQKDVSKYDIVTVVFFVDNEETALILADRWCNEKEQKDRGFKVVGIDRNFSVFD